MDTSDLTHTVTITISGNYPHGDKTHEQVTIGGDGSISHMILAFRTAMVAAGFSAETISGRNTDVSKRHE
jgi:hypothetical protein